ncbi:unnamed protein product [Candidula unifasciata]|uniref:Uncharacterized protein n=1 Tax=Candidula unifasciata TaxID=100452 RepID=A0A8S3ZHR5_9EUPU|nr:unnamed protein product [Candidula unifasciata]
MSKFILLSVAIVVCLLQPYLTNGQGFTTCTYYSNCTAETNLGVLDLNYARSNDPYSSLDTSTNNNYLWKSCEDFTIHGVTAGAIQEPTGSYSVDLGVHSTTTCSVGASGYISFTMRSADSTRTSVVKCFCGSSTDFQFVSESPTYTFHFNFVSDACCPNYVPSSSSSISPGTLIVIIFLSVAVLYILFGTIFQVAVRKAQGRERIPNVSLWTAFPGLVRDGFIFTFTCGRRSGYGKI